MLGLEETRSLVQSQPAGAPGTGNTDLDFFYSEQNGAVYHRVVRITTFGELLIVFNLVGGLRE